MLNEWIKYKDKMKRQFTVMAFQQCELLSFSINDLNRMKAEFLDAYEDLFNDAYQRLFRALKIKLSAMKHCQTELEKEINRKLQYNMASMFKK